MPTTLSGCEEFDVIGMPTGTIWAIVRYVQGEHPRTLAVPVHMTDIFAKGDLVYTGKLTNPSP